MSGTLQGIIEKNPDDEEVLVEADDEQEATTAEKLYRVSEATNDDGTVDVTVTDWDEETTRSGKPRGQLYIEFSTPTGQTEREVMAFPKKDDPAEYKFVRLVNNMGLSLRAAMVESSDDEDMGDVLVGQTIKADPDTWELEAPEPKPRHEELWENTLGSRRARLWFRVARYYTFHLSVVTFIVTGLLLLSTGGATLGLVTAGALGWVLVNAFYGVGVDG